MSQSPRYACNPADEAARLVQAILEACREGVCITAPDGNIEWVNPAFTTITGYELEEVLGQNPRVLRSDRHDEAFYASMWRQLTATGSWTGEIWNRRKSGEAYPEWLSIHAVTDGMGTIQRFVSVFSDLSDLKRHQELLHHEAYHDPLTSLPNRHLFLDRLGVALKQAAQSGDSLAIICLDLDRFKTINDSMGHVAGDIVLSEVGFRLSTLIGQADTLSRFSGDDFYVLLSGLRDPEDAAHMAGRILTRLSEPMEVLDQELQLGASLGITVAPADGRSPEQLMRNAEMAMYRAKDSGRNNFAFFTEELGERAIRGMQLENDLRKALARQEFVLYYQPRADVRTGIVTGMEALVRWIPENGEPISPAEFIPLAEETGLILPLGDWVMEEACRQTKALGDRGFANLKVSVNLSPRQMDQPGLAEKILGMLERTGLPPTQLEVEVTESVFLKGYETPGATLRVLNDAGVTVALDDFGTGYSCLAYLKKLPIQTLKIDKSFVDGLPDDKDDVAIVTSVVSIARNLGMGVVAEGVETLAQLEFLRGLNCCDGYQGYYFARPLPLPDFTALLSRGGMILPGDKLA